MAAETTHTGTTSEPPRRCTRGDAARSGDARRGAQSGAEPGLAPMGGFRSITWRVLAVNVLALAILVVGLLYLDRYKQNLIRSELDSLSRQAGIFAAALGEAAVTSNPNAGRDFLTVRARPIVRRLAPPAGVRARLFAVNGDLIADSQFYGQAGGKVQIAELPPPPQDVGALGVVVDIYDWVVRQLPVGDTYPPYVEHAEIRAEHYPVAQKALVGEVGRSVRMMMGGRLVLLVAVPVQRYKQVLGALMLSADDERIEKSLRSVRLEILSVFVGVLIVTVLLSLWLAGTIARPVRRLAAAARRVRSGRGREDEIPDFTVRGDEIGELSGALRDMTRALWDRMEAIAHFAADVAHEIKNPLTSLRSAVETAARVEDAEQQRRLMSIILDDVQRLDRLITDISDASRLDAELSRAGMEPVDVRGLLNALVEVERTSAEADGDSAPRLELTLLDGASLMVMGIEDRLAQVLRNLIANAVSFSPPNGTIRLAGERRSGRVRISVEDEGPGLPPDKLEAIFDRFYSERPAGEKFGTHSGLGLSISKQIVTAHNGRIRAENIDRAGEIVGARFIVDLPAVDGG